MKSKFIIFLLSLIIVLVLMGLFTTEDTRQVYRWRIQWAISGFFKANPNIPTVEKVPVYGQGECDSYKSNPEYEKYIQEHPKKEIDIEECIRAKNLDKKYESIARMNCESKALLPDPYAPPQAIQIKISCQKIMGYDKVFKLYRISWFKVGYEAK